MKYLLIAVMTIGLASHASASEVLNGFYMALDSANKTIHYFSDGTYKNQAIKYENNEFGLEVHSESTYSQNENTINLENGDQITYIDECRIEVGDTLFYRQACMVLYLGEVNSYRPDQTLFIAALSVRDSSKPLNLPTTHAVELKLTSSNPMIFTLTSSQETTQPNITGTYDLANVDISTNKLTISSVTFVNNKNHVFDYHVTLKQISSNPLMFEATEVNLFAAYDFWTGQDVSELYQ